jgi:anti-sigma regulatory factor (Ser/Thr protein kinase)
MSTAPLRDPLSFPLSEPTQVGDARRTAAALAERLGFDETRRAELSIVVTELGNNLVNHGRGGEMIVQSVQQEGVTGLEVLAIDKGPGIANVGRALQDGYSTGGTHGSGLGAVRRQSAGFDLYSSDRSPAGTNPAAAVAAGGASAGTVVVARLWAQPLPRRLAIPGRPAGPALDYGVVCLPKPGEDTCGDAWAVSDPRPGRSVVMVADGLGHGFDAAQASRQAVRLFRENVALEPVMLMEALHAGMRATRGAAVAIADLRFDRREVRFVGVGNVSATVLAPGPSGGTEVSRSMTSQNGTVGAEARRIQEFVYPWPAGAMLVMHSDGLGGHWMLGHYPGLRNKQSSVIAGVLYRDNRRIRDDVTVLVARENREGAEARTAAGSSEERTA